MLDSYDVDGVIAWLEEQVEDLKRDVANDYRIDNRWARGHLNGRFDERLFILKELKKARGD